MAGPYVKQKSISINKKSTDGDQKQADQEVYTRRENQVMDDIRKFRIANWGEKCRKNEERQWRKRNQLTTCKPNR